MNDRGIHGELTPKRRFAALGIVVPGEKKQKLLHRFVTLLLTGARDNKFERYFGVLMSTGKNLKASIPLCYVLEIFVMLNVNDATVQIIKILRNLESHLEQVNSGMEWECSVQLAIVLRMLEAHWVGTSGPFNITPGEVKPELKFLNLPPECVSLKDAKVRMATFIETFDRPTLIYVDSCTALFPVVEGFVIYTSGDARSAVIKGFQSKKANATPSQPIDLSDFNGGAVLVRGSAPNNPRVEPLTGWFYMTNEAVMEFLGNSLLLAIPREMLGRKRR
jgi:hypothetical protein